ncbi:hypothetical protein LQZ21_03975 [Treponema sp. TIM-1]|uniref:hypothetical protein n=1 Tax=Treponema sp. TIM-1 TaxID=2898417 RepID=UPI0039809420
MPNENVGNRSFRELFDQNVSFINSCYARVPRRDFNHKPHEPHEQKQRQIGVFTDSSFLLSHEQRREFRHKFRNIEAKVRGVRVVRG